MFLIPPKLPYSAGLYEELFSFGNALKLKDGVVLKEKKTEKGKVIFSLYELELNVKYVTEQDIIIQRISDTKISVKKRIPPIVPNKLEQQKEQTHETNGVHIREIRSQDSSPSDGEASPATFARSNPITIPSSVSFHPSNMKKVRTLSSIESGSETETQRSEVSHLETDSLSGTVASSLGSLLPSFEEIGFSTGALSALKGTTSPPFVAIGVNALEGSSSSNRGTPSSLDSIFNTAPLIVDIATPHIPGEKVELVIEEVVVVKPSSSKNSTGILYITNYQLIFVAFGEQDKPEPAPSALSSLSTLAFTQTQNASTPQPLTKNRNGNSNANNPHPARHDIEAPLPVQMNERYQIELMVPLTAIAKFDKVDRQNSTFMFGGENSYSIDVTFKDFRRPLRFLLTPQKHSRRDICNYLAKTVFPQTINDVFAVSAKYPDPIDSGWKLYDVEQEFGRMGVTDTSDNLNTSDSSDTSDELVKWCFVDINDNYGLCESYPRKLVVPEKVSAKDLMEVANFRSKGRIPVLVWRNKETGVSMSRCSQPKTGMSRTYRNKSDEKVLRMVQRTNPSSRVLHIMDARPMANAFANMALGGGYENLSYYPDCELEFMGVANIHVVRDSYNKLRDLCEQATLCFDDSYKNTNSTSNVSMLITLETTHWLDHLSSIISASSRVVHLMDVKKESILIHCSDGWDRTSQVCALAQLLLDPYYRTIKGFLILLEKSWLQFGHKFGDRLGLNFEDNAYKDAERSPIFLQFIDATWQIMIQFPQAFEFTEDMLICIMEHVYSGRFGTFLFNTEKEREHAKLAEISPSLWTYILRHSEHLLNPFFTTVQPVVLYPSVDILSMKLWKHYYFKHLLADNCSPCKIEWPIKSGKNPYVGLGKQLRSRIDALEDENSKLKRDYEDMGHLLLGTV